MSRRFRRARFDEKGPFVTRMNLLFNGVVLRPGDPFPAEGVSRSRLRGLYNRRRIDLTSAEGQITDTSGKPIGPHWSNLADKDLLRFAFKVTGTRRRNPEIARAELAALEAAGELNAWTTGRTDRESDIQGVQGETSEGDTSEGNPRDDS